MTRINDPRTPGLQPHQVNVDVQKSPQKTTTRAVQQQPHDRVDQAGKAEKIATARALVSRDVRAGEHAGPGAKPGVAGAVASLPRPGKTDLATAARGAAPSWASLTTFSSSQLRDLSIAVPTAEWDQAIPASTAALGQSSSYRVVSVADLLRARLSEPAAFACALERTGGEALRQTAAGDVEINPFAVKARAEWEQRGMVAAGAQADRQRSGPGVEVVEQRAPDHREGDGQQGEASGQGGGQSEHHGDRDDPEAEEIALLASSPEAFVSALPDDVTLIRGASLFSTDEVRSALYDVAAVTGLGQTSSGLTSVATTATSGSDPLGSVLGAINDPSVPIEDLLFMLMLGMSQESEDALRDKMAEAAEQEQREGARDRADSAAAAAEGAAEALSTAVENGASSSEIAALTAAAQAAAVEAQEAAAAADAMGSGTGKSATMLASEVQMLMNEWKQMNEMMSNLMKTMHDMAMTPIRNLR